MTSYGLAEEPDMSETPSVDILMELEELANISLYCIEDSVVHGENAGDNYANRNSKSESFHRGQNSLVGFRKVASKSFAVFPQYL